MVVAAGPCPVAGYVVATASDVSYGQLLTTFRQAGVSFATPFNLVFPECEYSTIWRCSSAETGVKSFPRLRAPTTAKFQHVYVYRRVPSERPPYFHVRMARKGGGGGVDKR